MHSTIPTLEGQRIDDRRLVSGIFLLVIGALNLLVLLEIVGVFRRMKRGKTTSRISSMRSLNQGFLARFLLKRVGSRIDASWKMYPLGVLFGLGFDTATEIALLAVAAGVATHHVPFLAVISLPLIFAAGMSLMDTADGAFMSHAYGWAFASPVRRSTTTSGVTSLSVAVALDGRLDRAPAGARGEARVARRRVGASWNSLDLGRLGYLVVGLFVTTWALLADALEDQAVRAALECAARTRPIARLSRPRPRPRA